MNRYRLDDLDRMIIDVLGKDARVSNRKIAASLGVTEGTIRGRIKRLQEENYIRFTAITNPVHLGNPRLVLIGIVAVQSSVRELAQVISDMPGIRAVIVTLGRFDILAVGLFDELEAMQDVANNSILPLPGVRHLETSVVVKTLKYNSRFAKIIPPGGRKKSGSAKPNAK
jgi:Lrp/AsnC family transcriptional regulator, regulator for asnA, asnC and gidA